MLYHYQVYMPKNLKLPQGVPLLLKYSDHAISAASTDRYGPIRLPKVLNINQAKVIEVETDDNHTVIKVLYRIYYGCRHHLSIAIKPCGIVKTVWLNETNDRHYTLDRNKYHTGE